MLYTISKQSENLKDTSKIVAFSDGSTLGNPGPTGAGVIYHNGMSSIPTKLASGVSKLNNNVHGEIFAIKLACSNIATIVKDQHRSVNIFSDCQAAILVVLNMEKAVFAQFTNFMVKVL